MKKLRRSMSLVVVAVAAMVVPTVPAAAVPHAVEAVFTGSGTVFPGFTTTPTPQTMTMNGQMTGTFVAGTTATPGMLACQFSGTVTPASAMTANLAMSGSCTGAGTTTISLTCNVTGTITLPPLCVTLVGNCVLQVGTVRVTITIRVTICYLATTTTPTTSFVFEGDAFAAGP